MKQTVRPEDVLRPEHLYQLRDESGISDNVIMARGYRTALDPSELMALDFKQYQARPGFLIPIHTPDGENSLYRLKPDNPRVREKRNRGKLEDGTYPQQVIKYEQPSGNGLRIDCNPLCRPMLKDPSVDLFITEGEKKADAIVSRGGCALSLPGVWGFKHKNQWGGVTISADLDYIAWNGRNIYLVFDDDVTRNKHVRQALERLAEHLKRKGAL